MKRMLVLLVIACPLFGQEEDQELAEMLAVIESETAIATRTRMNSDYVPGIVTVLEGDEMEALGFETVWEALAMVPGMQPVRDPAASPSVIVRGIQFPFNNGNVKILIDGVPLSREAAGINSTALNLPVEAVERVEVIRGPGSVIYGDFAFMGIVNIVTRRDRSELSLRGNGDAVSGLARFATDGAWQFAATVAALQGDDVRVHRGRHAEEERHAAILSLRRGGFSLSGQYLQRDIADLTSPLPPGPRVAADESSWAAQAQYGTTIAPGLQASVTAAILDTRMLSGGSDYADGVRRFAFDLQWDRWTKQSWLVGAEFSSLEIEEAVHRTPVPNQPPTVIRGAKREVSSLVLQDRIEVSPAITITAGARLDDYNDVGTRATPRLSVVWRASDSHILKAQYAEGFRAPTFFEEYGGGGTRNRNLDFEVNATTELNYVFRRPRMAARATLFHSDLKDMIFGSGGGGRFGNTRDASADGVELEWSQQVTEKVKVVTNVAFVETEDNRNPTLTVRDSEAAADWMSDVALLVRPVAHTIVSLHWNHVGDRQVAARGEGYDDLGVTFTRQDLGLQGLSVRGGIKNALDDDIGYIGVRPTGDVDALVYEGRVWWVGVAFRP